MLIFYVDESGHHTLKRDPNDESKLAASSEWFVLGTAGVRDTARKSLAEELQRIKKVHFGDLAESSNWNDTELKGRYLALTRQRLNGVPIPKRPPVGYDAITTIDQLRSLERDIRVVIARYRPIVFAVSINKAQLIQERPDATALGSAYAYLYRRVALTLQRLFIGEGGVFVADQQAEHEKHFDSGELNAVRDRINRRGKQRAQYELILDKPLWIDTNLSSWDREILQLADIAAFMVGELVRNGTAPMPADLWSELRRCMAAGMDGEPDGEGLMIYPMPEVWPTTH